MDAAFRDKIMSPGDQLLDFATVINMARVMEPAEAERVIARLQERGWITAEEACELLAHLGLEAA